MKSLFQEINLSEARVVPAPVKDLEALEALRLGNFARKTEAGRAAAASAQKRKKLDLLIMAANPNSAEEAIDFAVEEERHRAIERAMDGLLRQMDSTVRDLLPELLQLSEQIQVKARQIAAENLEVARRRAKAEIAPFFPAERLSALCDFTSGVADELGWQRRRLDSAGWGGGVVWVGAGYDKPLYLEEYNLSALLAIYHTSVAALEEAKIRGDLLAQLQRT